VQNGETTPPSRAPWVWLGLLALTHFLMMADRNLPVLVLPVLQRRFALSDTSLGLLQGPAFVLFYVVATLAAGRVVDRLPRFALLAVSVVLWSAASIGFGLARSWTELVACRLLLGLFQALVAPTALSLIGERAPSADVGRFVSIFTTGSALGRSGALLVGGLVLAWSASPMARTLLPGLEAWRILFLLSALPNLLVALGLFLLGARREAQSGSLRGPSIRPALSWFRAWPTAFACHLLAAGCVIILVQAVAAWTPTLLQRELGLSAARSGLVAGLIVVVGAPLGHLGGGALMDVCRRVGLPARLVMIVALMFCVIGAGLLCVPASLAAFGSGVFLLTVFGGMAGVAVLTAFQLMLPGAHGSANAIYFATITLMGLGFGPPVIGLLSDRVFGPHALGLALFCTATVMAVAATALTVGSQGAHARVVLAAEAARRPASLDEEFVRHG
jgi:MFS family permease